MSYEIIDYGDKNIVVSTINGNQIILDKNIKQTDFKHAIKKYNLLEQPYMTNELSPTTFKVIYISLHTSSRCNLSCTYCFLKDKTSSYHMNIDVARRFIDYIIFKYPHAEKYIIDPTGSGEPLLNMKLITEIGEYCKTKSNEIKKEVLPMLVTNGVLLNKDNVQKLKEAGILFGVSIDGTKNMHNKYRKDFIGKGTYSLIIRNIRQIKNRSLMGGAVTLTEANEDVRKVLKHLVKYFPTVSIKPVRNVNKEGGIHEGNINKIITEYSKLTDFLLRQTFKRNFAYIAAILNGDDYFGKFVLRVILNQKVSTRCDAGIGRFSLAGNSKIYACPAAIGIKPLEIGSLKEGIDEEKQKNIADVLVKQEKCANCRAKFVCGGECMVTSYYANKSIKEFDPIMCKLKIHLFDLAVKLKFTIAIQDNNIYEMIYKSCKEKSDRFREDLDLKATLNENDQFSFTELKAIKDNNLKMYEEIKKNNRGN